MSDIDTAAADSLKVLDPKRPIREADMAGPAAGSTRSLVTHVRHWRIAFVVMHNRARLQGRKAAATDKLLVDNPIDRYKIGTDTKGLETAPDGSITIVISRDRPTGENASNWLPAPDGLFSLFLRLYQPSEAVRNGTWAPPQVVKIK